MTQPHDGPAPENALVPHTEGTHAVALADTDRFPNPGLPPHSPRRGDLDEKAAKRYEKQVATLFGISMLGALGFVVAYFAIDTDWRIALPGFGTMSGYHAVLGVTLGLSTLCLGLGVEHWAKTLMSDHEVSEERHEQKGTAQEQAKAAGLLSYGWRDSQLNRRPLLLGTLGGALGLFAVPVVLPVIAGLGPLPGNSLSITNWQQGMRLMIDPAGTPIRPEHVTQGSVFHVMPEGFVGPEAEHGDHAVSPHDLMVSKGKDQIILVRLNPELIKSQKQRDWGVEGIVAYSKVCTHVGCPVALYEQQTHHLLCPCHQSTFDMTDDCKVIFGPAKRALPQLPISVDDEGYLVASGPFEEPVGPSFWERGE